MPDPKYVYRFPEGDKDQKELLGPDSEWAILVKEEPEEQQTHGGDRRASGQGKKTKTDTGEEGQGEGECRAFGQGVDHQGGEKKKEDEGSLGPEQVRKRNEAGVHGVDECRRESQLHGRFPVLARNEGPGFRGVLSRRILRTRSG